MKKNFQGIAKENLSPFVDIISTLIRPGTILFFDGDPGVGKTYLISEILKKHNISAVSSPTFALHHQYESGTMIDYKMDQKTDAELGRQKLIFHHFDLYRVESMDELETVGLWELFSQDPSGRFTCYLIEWGSKFPSGIWPLHFKKMEIFIAAGDRPEIRHYTLTVD